MILACIFKGKTITTIGIITAADKYHSFGIFLNQSWNKKYTTAAK